MILKIKLLIGLDMDKTLCGIVICPPALIGEKRDKSGEASDWWQYL